MNSGAGPSAGRFYSEWYKPWGQVNVDALDLNAGGASASWGTAPRVWAS